MRHILFFFLILISTKGHSQECLKDSIISDFVNGKLLLVNHLEIVNTNDAFFEKLLSLDFTDCEVLDGEKGKELYGTMGEHGVVSITISNVEGLKQEYVDLVDASILKYFNKEDAILYHTNGIPNRDIYRALSTLINMKIEEVDIIDKNEARAIWGEQAKNGAIMIKCNQKERLTIISE